MIERWIVRVLERWVAGVTAYPWWVLAAIALVTVACGWASVQQFRINSNLSDLIEQDAGWRDDFDRFEAEFPDMVRTAVVVIWGDEFKQVEDTAVALESRIRANTDLFTAVYAPQNAVFFRDNTLLYMDLDEVEDMADRLAEAQPVLTSVAEDPSLRGILELVAGGIENDPPSGLDTIVTHLVRSGEAVLAGEDATVLWTNELFEIDPPVFRVISLKGRKDSGIAVPNEEVMSGLREIVSSTPLPEGVTVEITGEIALAFEEIQAAVTGVQMAGWLSLALLAAVLFIGVRSLRIIAATLLMLGVGAVWTAAYAMLAVGEYNTLSVVFIVMFFGLSVDFAIHFSLRYQEAVNIGVVSPRAALGTATRSVGGAIAICTLTTALGFLGFVPTAYKGLADLGIISAGGMFIAAFLAFTLLPAFYTLCGRIRSHKTDLPSSEKFVVLLVTNRSVVVGAIALLSVGALMFAARAEFDYSVLALKDENAESMVALRRLQSEKLATDYVLHVLTDRPLEEAALEELTMVDSVVTRLDYVPSDQDEKLYIIEDLNALLYSALDPARKAAAPGVADLRHHTTVLLEVAQSYNVAGRYDALIEALTGLKVAGDAELLAWQRGMVANLEDELDWLRRALDARAIVFEDLPPDLRERLVGNTGQHLSVVLPQENVARVETLSRFIEDVRSVAPRATGRPVIEWGVGDIVVTSFQQALVFALVSILLVLLIMFRKVRWALMIAIPLTLSALFTLAFGVLLDAPLNMANILVLPLIFGLGVDNGIHVVDRYRSAGDVEHLMHSSTPRAVLLSTLTTVGTFAALSFSPHQGMASIGVLLTVAVAMLLFFAIFLLPVLLSWLEPRSPLVERAM